MTRYSPTGSSAEGGIGSVVFCHDKNLDRKVAVKVLQRGGEHRRLLDELAALQRIRSKHVVEIFDVTYFDRGATMGIVEEYIEGDDLDKRLGAMRSSEEFLRLLYQMSAGLADIHAVGVVHRDIKPSNMRIDGEGILKIIDFNLARPKSDAETKGFVGTRGYAAPELYSDDQVTFGTSVDVYALGVTAYALLKGSDLPADLRGRPPRADAWKSASGGFAGLNTGMDSELVRLLDACLEEDPSKRPTASEISGRAQRMLLHGKHRALFATEDGRRFEVHAGRPRVALKHPASLGQVTIAYDNLDFKVVEVDGEVWANNMQVTRGMRLPACCVIALGGPNRRASDRMFVTMDESQPEVVL